MKNLSNIKEKLLVEQVEEMLYKLIKEEPYPKGTKLPNEFKLGEHFGVSRNTVREAIRSLTSKGVLEVRRGSGTYVVNTMLLWWYNSSCIYSSKGCCYSVKQEYCIRLC